MKIGDKVIVTYSDGDQLVGTIIGETEKMWQIDFDGEEKTRRVRKSMDIQLVEDVKEDVKEEEVAEEVLDPGLTNEDIEEPTEEEFAEPVGEPKKKTGMVIAAILVLAAIAGVILLKVFGVF